MSGRKTLLAWLLLVVVSAAMPVAASASQSTASPVAGLSTGAPASPAQPTAVQGYVVQAAAVPTLSLNAYLQMMRKILASLDSSEGPLRRDPEEFRRRMEGAAAAIPATVRVRMPDGETVEVDERWIIQGLTELSRAAGGHSGAAMGNSGAAMGDSGVAAARNAALRERLEFLVEDLERLREVPGGRDKDRDRAQLRKILSAREFRPRPGAGGAFLTWLSDLLSRLLGGLELPDPRYQGLGKWIALGGLAVTFALVGLVYRWLRRATVPEAAWSDSWGTAGAAATADFEGGAAAAAAVGEYREAIRLTYLGALRRLQAIGAIDYEPARTNREHLARLRRRNSPLYEAFSRLTLLFDRKWYGHEPAQAEDLRVFRETAALIARPQPAVSTPEIGEQQPPPEAGEGLFNAGEKEGPP